MEKSIVHELQDLAANGQTPILDVLRKALMVASKLKIQDFREWVEDELGGYRIKSKPPRGGYSVKSPPPYRSVFFHPHESRDGKLISKDTSWYGDVYDPISELQTLSSAGIGIFYANNSNILFMPNGSIQCHSGEQFVNILDRSQLIGILNRVRDIVLRWALKLEEQGIMGDGMTFSAAEKATAANNSTIQIEHFTGQLRQYSR